METHSFTHLRRCNVGVRAAGAEEIGPAGYSVANALAETNLRLGHSVVADCVNPVRDSRLGWSAAMTSPADLLAACEARVSRLRGLPRRAEARPVPGGSIHRPAGLPDPAPQSPA